MQIGQDEVEEAKLESFPGVAVNGLQKTRRKRRSQLSADLFEKDSSAFHGRIVEYDGLGVKFMR